MKLAISLRTKAWSPVLVDSTLLEEYWSRHQDYYPSYKSLPHVSWFGRFKGNVPISFRPAAVYFTAENNEGLPMIKFSNGRHRTRWLLERGSKEVVIAISNGCLAEAQRSGLVQKNLDFGDVFDFGSEVGEIDGFVPGDFE